MWKKFIEKIEEINILKKYKVLLNDWTIQNKIIDNQKQKISSNENKMAALKSINVNLNKEIEKLNGLVNHKESQRKVSASAIGGYVTSIKKLKNRINELEKDNKDLTSINRSIGSQLAEITLEKDKLFKLIDKLQKQNTWLKKRVPKPTLKQLEDYTFKRGEMR